MDFADRPLHAAFAPSAPTGSEQTCPVYDAKQRRALMTINALMRVEAMVACVLASCLLRRRAVGGSL